MATSRIRFTAEQKAELWERWRNGAGKSRTQSNAERRRCTTRQERCTSTERSGHYSGQPSRTQPRDRAQPDASPYAQNLLNRRVEKLHRERFCSPAVLRSRFTA